MIWNPFRKTMEGKRASDISGTAWFNKSALTDEMRERVEAGKPLRFTKDLSDHVVLIDFWDYSCINCINTLPYLREWWERYKEYNFLIIGVHTPEFAFGADETKVRNAVLRFNIDYPVVSDAEYETWERYGNTVWPRKLLVDHKGKIRYDHSGEGAYEETEAAIQSLIHKLHPDAVFSDTLKPIRDVDEPGAVCRPTTPELYLGYARGKCANEGGIHKDKEATYKVPQRLTAHQWALHGKWRVQKEEAVAVDSSAVLMLQYLATEVFAVMRSDSGGPVRVEVRQRNAPLTAENKGEDVVIEEDGRSIVMVDEDRLYRLVANAAHGEHELTLQPESPGLAVHTFTFGSSCE